MTPCLRLAGLLLLAGSVASCGMFGGTDDDEELEPIELVDFQPQITVRKLWSAKLGGDAEFLRVALQPAGDGNRIYAASPDGSVYAFEPEKGRQQWRNKLDVALTAGPGVGEGLVVVASADGFVIALDAASGAEKWRSNVSGEVLSVPAIKGDAVVVQTIDNRLRALSVFDGTERWLVEQSTPLLTMRGSSTPVIVGSNVVAGFDNGRLAAVNLQSGDVEWESVLAPPSGRSDLERLSDIDGKIAAVNQDVYASGYQGRIAAVASESGQILWARELSSYEGVAADWSNLYTVTDNGEVVALSRRDGTESWRQASLLRREPTVPVPFNTTVAVGDLEGYVHFFNTVDGVPVARVKAAGKAISADPVVVADRLYVQSDAGTLAAYSVVPPKRERRAPDTADSGS